MHNQHLSITFCLNVWISFPPTHQHYIQKYGISIYFILKLCEQCSRIHINVHLSVSYIKLHENHFCFYTMLVLAKGGSKLEATIAVLARMPQVQPSYPR